MSKISHIKYVFSSWSCSFCYFHRFIIIFFFFLWSFCYIFLRSPKSEIRNYLLWCAKYSCTQGCHHCRFIIKPSHCCCLRILGALKNYNDDGWSNILLTSRKWRLNGGKNNRNSEKRISYNNKYVKKKLLFTVLQSISNQTWKVESFRNLFEFMKRRRILPKWDAILNENSIVKLI